MRSGLFGVAVLWPILGATVGAGWNTQGVLPDDLGSIKGKVVDSGGVPVAGARVTATRDGIGAMPLSVTDSRGMFELSGVRAGAVRVVAEKMEAGFPDVSAIFVDHLPPVIRVRAGAATEDVVVRLGPKLGVLRGRVVDAETGAGVRSARVRITREDAPLFYSMSVDLAGNFVLTWPSHPTTLDISAPEFNDWRSGVDVPQAQVAVPSGAEKTLVVRLRRR